MKHIVRVVKFLEGGSINEMWKTKDRFWCDSFQNLI